VIDDILFLPERIWFIKQEGEISPFSPSLVVRHRAYLYGIDSDTVSTVAVKGTAGDPKPVWISIK
jgi:hypothetical protein